MADWKKVLLSGDAAELTSNAPPSVGTTVATGTGTEAARDDHVHDIGAGAIDASNLFAAGVVDATALGTDAVADGTKIADAAVDSEHIAADAVQGTHVDSTESFEMAKLTLSGNDPGSEIVITPKATSTSTAEGTIFYDSDDDHIYVYVV